MNTKINQARIASGIALKTKVCKRLGNNHNETALKTKVCKRLGSNHNETVLKIEVGKSR